MLARNGGSLLLFPSQPRLCFAFSVQVKLHGYWKVSRQLQREKNDNRALTRCIQELRMKGASFDLSKEPHSGKSHSFSNSKLGAK
ncbi:hypothetical protein L6164_023972 [Bauhinia variegata]|uniref:Uncharacterized protein n=1 Tax=Bauhinia variegata TaxID=167791 RepID=A0ACB9LXN1_BAUVA|nr:hypothetical protein L6164_023972 [Bauhinia variegata]